ncbi:uncharacterized protein LOC110848205 [Folsomia candida]|uniref:LolA-like domain-containing protein n=1 Tax=Folsomia candida TaxID=158441 RepID=A0A226EDX8_FOLCA|nr:uncharacterized protein LOC110848205 [Folsomia candida]OXA55344.1 hypothetical protein Fcan01_08598 [Folsomia candida]
MKTSSPIFSVFFSVFCNIVSGLDSGVHNPGPELNVKLRDLAGGVGVGGFNPLLVDDKVRDDSDRGRSGDGVDIRGDPGHSVGNADDASGQIGGEASVDLGDGGDSRLLLVEGDARRPGLLSPDVYPVDSFPPKAPIIPDIFTVAVETIYMKEQKRQVWNLHVDRAEKIVVHKVDMPNTVGKRYEWFYSKIVRDFRSGLEFRISNGKEATDCIVEPISTDFELTSHNLKRFMLEHATLLLNFDPSFVNYWGKRSIRNLQCDIWLHESLGEFVSEFGFANDSTLPISVATFSRKTTPDIVAISNIYEDNSHIFNPFAKTQGHPDVTACLDPTPLLLRIVLDAPYAKLKLGREFTVLESIRRAVAGLAGISLLRVTDLALTEWPGGTTAFWFSLRQIVNFQELSKNNNSSSSTHSTIVFPLADAYRILRDVIQRHDVTLRVDLATNEHMLVGIQRGSLISIPRALHPIFMRNSNTKSLSVIKASYTSGAVAGLGLAMAVLGLAIGLLLGFVLWNGSTRVRYWRYPWSNIPYGLDT